MLDTESGAERCDSGGRAFDSSRVRVSLRAGMAQRDGIAPHDPVGSNIHLHVRRGRVLRVVPRANESINEVWPSDRDRFGYEGLYSEDRVLAPMVERDGTWTGRLAEPESVERVTIHMACMMRFSHIPPRESFR